MKIKRLQKGQTLIEVLIALAAAVAVVAAIAVTVVTSLSNVDYTKNQNLATQYSREGLEIIRQIAKNNWTDFSTNPNYRTGSYCLSEGSSLPQPEVVTCAQNVGLQNGNYILKREIIINQNDATYCSGNVSVISTVSWSDSRCQTGNSFCHKVSLESCLANINTVKSP